MAMTAKMDLVREVERNLSNVLTAQSMADALRILSDALENYSVEKILTEAPADGDDLMEIYMSAMRVEGRSEKTLEQYRGVLRRMLAGVNVKTRRVTVYHLRQYLASEKARGISDRTLEGNRQVFSAYFNWLQREGLIDKNPTANLGAIKHAKKQKDVFTEVDMEKLKFGCTCDRDRAILYFLRATGCRISEMVQLNREDVDLQNLRCKVLGKGNKERIIYMDAVTAMSVRRYLDGRADREPALFIGSRMERLQPGGVRYMLQQLAARTGVHHVHPHKFRRTAATSLIRHGMPIQEVASILGHDKLDTTMQYVVMDQTITQNSYNRYAG